MCFLGLSRYKAGLTQLQLATALGIHPNTLSKIETGRYKPSKKLRARVENFFNTDYDRLTSQYEKLRCFR